MSTACTTFDSRTKCAAHFGTFLMTKKYEKIFPLGAGRVAVTALDFIKTSPPSKTFLASSPPLAITVPQEVHLARAERSAPGPLSRPEMRAHLQGRVAAARARLSRPAGS